MIRYFPNSNDTLCNFSSYPTELQQLFSKSVTAGDVFISRSVSFSVELASSSALLGKRIRETLMAAAVDLLEEAGRFPLIELNSCNLMMSKNKNNKEVLLVPRAWKRSSVFRDEGLIVLYEPDFECIGILQSDGR